MTTLKERIEKKIAQVNGCWLWLGAKDRDGYGVTTVNQKSMGAHKASYELFVGKVPGGLQLDHLCGNKACVNPDHLEPVTPRTNTLRASNAPATINFNKTHCKHGHEFTEENIYHPPKYPRKRHCKTCRLRRGKAFSLRAQGVNS